MDEEKWPCLLWAALVWLFALGVMFWIAWLNAPVVEKWPMVLETWARSL